MGWRVAAVHWCTSRGRSKARRKEHQLKRAARALWARERWQRRRLPTLKSLRNPAIWSSA
eukprot:4904067-Alexandrium_andersonii.AAC.1